MSLVIFRVFHGVYTFHWLTTVIWLGLQGTNSESFDGVNATNATTTEQPKDLVTNPTTEAYNYTLGTMIIFRAVCI